MVTPYRSDRFLVRKQQIDFFLKKFKKKAFPLRYVMCYNVKHKWKPISGIRLKITALVIVGKPKSGFRISIMT